MGLGFNECEDDKRVGKSGVGVIGEDWVMNRCSTGTTVLERESARYRSSEQRYRYNKICV